MNYIMSLQQFENTITAMRDVLRTEGITGMDSIHHCVAFTLMRFLTVETCAKFGIPEKFSYENFLIDHTTRQKYADGDPRIIIKFYTNNDSIAIEDIMYGYFIQVFGYKFSFKIKSSYNFANIFKKLATTDIHTLAHYCDIIGTIYELHLKSGSSSSMRDLGQYFTHRKVIKYMVDLCNPIIKDDGSMEKVLDPSMGSGGFLAMAIKHINSTCDGIDWSTDKLNFFGFDIDENVKNLASLNLLLETSELFDTTLIHLDSLQNDYRLNDGAIVQKVDVILANEPFGVKGLKYKDCCQRIKNLKIDGTKAEPLFLQLMMQSLNEGGRCAVIVPDGVLFNDAKLHSDTRKYLVENLNLLKVVKLGEKTFLNTGVNSSILFFSNTGQTREVSFDTIKLNNGNIIEEHNITVSYHSIVTNKYDLNPGKYTKVDDDRIEGLEYKRLEEICTFLPTTKHVSSIGQLSGLYRFYNSSQEDKLYVNKYEINKESIIIGNGGNLCVHYDIMFTPSKHVTVLQNNNNNVNLKYIYYFLLQNKTLLEKLSAGTTIKWLNKTNMGTIQIPIPTLEQQTFIVESCDSFMLTINNLNVNIVEYEKQKKAVVYTMTCWCDVKMKLGEICKNIKTGKNKPSDNKTGSLYPYYGTGGITGYTDEYLIDGEYILIARNGTVGQSLYASGKSYPSDHMFIIKDMVNVVLLKYLYYAIQNIVNLAHLAVGTTIKGISKQNLESIDIPIPTLEEQQEIIKICEYYDDMINKAKEQIDYINKLQKNIIDKVLASNNINQQNNNVIEI